MGSGGIDFLVVAGCIACGWTMLAIMAAERGRRLWELRDRHAKEAAVAARVAARAAAAAIAAANAAATATAKPASPAES
ncbi:MAG: hypothetical protein ABR964_14750 [Tepidisphaeraceae bacterium]|jgi:hypothetical protein